MTTYVTKPFLPPLEEFLPFLEEIWDNRVLSNSGPNHSLFEKQLCEKLKIDHISLLGNGTLALLVAFKALGIENSEIITTPYSFVATSSSILWANNKPVFVDVEPNFVNIDPEQIKKAITPRTKAILAVHCYGYPCLVQRIEEIAKTHNLKVIYDGAHAFGVETKHGSIFKHGDLSILSFHATKVFNTFEGGAIVSNNQEMKEKINRLKNFGFVSEVEVNEIGINAKMNEVIAAIGILQLRYFEKIRLQREKIDQIYRSRLSNVKGIKCFEDKRATKQNFAYFPILVGDAYCMNRDSLYELMKKYDIFTRRYFYPLISDMNSYKAFSSASYKNLPYASRLAEQILCLPIYPELPHNIVEQVCEIIENQKITP